MIRILEEGTEDLPDRAWQYICESWVSHGVVNRIEALLKIQAFRDRAFDMFLQDGLYNERVVANMYEQYPLLREKLWNGLYQYALSQPGQSGWMFFTLIRGSFPNELKHRALDVVLNEYPYREYLVAALSFESHRDQAAQALLSGDVRGLPQAP